MRRVAMSFPSAENCAVTACATHMFSACGQGRPAAIARVQTFAQKDSICYSICLRWRVIRDR